MGETLISANQSVTQWGAIANRLLTRLAYNCYTVLMNPSPFPGMNPYLEGDMWSEFHERLASKISEQLMPLLLPKYVALLAKYHAVTTSISLVGENPAFRRAVYPDVHITQISPFPTSQTGGVAVLEPTATLPTATEVEQPISFIEIRDVSSRQLVTIIEILSPVNKQGKGFATYLAKRADIIQSDVHLVEIDLLRGGNGIELDGEMPKGDYFTFVSDSRRKPLTDIWAFRLRDKLPTVPVPLRSPEMFVALDLQQAIEDCYRTVPYDLLLDYDVSPPLPAFNESESVWIRQRVRKVK